MNGSVVLGAPVQIVESSHLGTGEWGLYLNIGRPCPCGQFIAAVRVNEFQVRGQLGQDPHTKGFPDLDE